MKSITITIEPFAPVHQAGVDSMLDTIANEFKEPFFHKPVKKMEDLYRLPGRSYWVAIADNVVIGSVGVIIADSYAILKSLFVAKAFRGSELNVAGRLIDCVKDEAVRRGCAQIFLGTMEQFKAAQRFYEKHGYKKIQVKELPGDYPHNALDVIFYRLLLPTTADVRDALRFKKEKAGHFDLLSRDDWISFASEIQSRTNTCQIFLMPFFEGFPLLIASMSAISFFLLVACLFFIKSFSPMYAINSPSTSIRCTPFKASSKFTPSMLLRMSILNGGRPI